MTFDGHKIYTATDGKWVVAVLMNNGTKAVMRDATRYASEASAALDAIRQHRERPHMNFVVMETS